MELNDISSGNGNGMSSESEDDEGGAMEHDLRMGSLKRSTEDRNSDNDCATSPKRSLKRSPDRSPKRSHHHKHAKFGTSGHTEPLIPSEKSSSPTPRRSPARSGLRALLPSSSSPLSRRSQPLEENDATLIFMDDDDFLLHEVSSV